MTQETITIENKTGIHARPASIFVQTATKFKSKIQLQAKGKTIDAKSILMIMSMGLVKGTEVTIIADGPDEAEAVKVIVPLQCSFSFISVYVISLLSLNLLPSIQVTRVAPA